MNYPNLLNALPQGSEIPFLTAGLASERGGYLMSAEQLNNVEAALAQLDEANEAVLSMTDAAEALQAERTALQAEAEQADENLATALQQIELLTAEVTAANARIAELEAQTDTPVAPAADQDPAPVAPRRAKYAHEILAEQYGL